MDRRTQDLLFKISRGIPRDLLKTGVIRSKPFSDQETALRDARANHSTPLEDRRKIDRILNDPEAQASFRKETTETNNEAGEKIKEYVDTKIKSAIRSGELKPADKNDPFFKFVDAHK